MTHKIMVLGASGMLGNAVFRYFASNLALETIGVVRSSGSAKLLSPEWTDKLAIAGNLEDPDTLASLLGKYRPTVVINCIGLVKQLEDAKNPLAAIPINSILPHRLAQLCALIGARLIHVSTDCVFAGTKGMYRETDTPDATDVYGRTKLMGEVDYPNAVTLRTSIIGHELAGNRSLIDWFLSQKGSVSGYSRAVFSGLPTVEIARVIDNYVLPHPDLRGLYHVSATPIDKFSLLTLVASVYGKQIVIADDPSMNIDRSLDSMLFRQTTGFEPDDWPTLVQRMRDFH